MSLSYGHPIKRAARIVLGVKPCACGCNFVHTRHWARDPWGRRGFVDWSRLGRWQKWATFDPDGG